MFEKWIHAWRAQYGEIKYNWMKGIKEKTMKNVFSEARGKRTLPNTMMWNKAEIKRQ